MIAKLRNWAALNPLARLALAGLAGIILTDHGFGRDHEAIILLLAGTSIFLVFMRPRWFPLEIPTAFVFAFIHQTRIAETAGHPLRAALSGKDRVEATIVGYLTAAAQSGLDGDGSRQQVKIEASSIIMPREEKHLISATSLRGWMTAKERLPPAGRYEFQGRLRLAQKPTNPGQFDGAAYALRQGIVADFDVRSACLLKRDWLPVHTSFLRAAQRSRDWIERQLEVGIEGEEQSLALIRGMTLGITDEASADLQRPFRNTGTLHVFSVSGLHVALISTIGWMFLSVLGVNRTAALFILIPGVFAYAFITGWRPSAARAAIMVTVFMAATLFDRKSRLQNSIGAAALVLLASDTHQLFTAGFQLSFGVLFAIALLNAPLLNLCRPWTELDPFLPAQLASWHQKRWAHFKTWLASSVSVSTAATAGSLPLMLWHFGLATPIAVLANCLLIPLAFVVLATACASLLFAAAHLGHALVLANNANWLFAKLMLGGAVVFSKVPGAYFTWQPGKQSASRPPIELTVLNLPYGEAAQHLRSGDSHWLLDTGSKRAFARIVQPLLQMQGADTLNGMVLSHSDIEHVGGAIRASSEHNCRLACVGVLEPWRYESGASGLKRFLASRQADSPSLQFLAEDDSLEFGQDATATVLYPSRKDLHDRGDDRAMVLLIRLGGFRILWCNDIGFVTEKTLMERHLLKSLRCDVLIRNQHAADYSALPEFLLAARPRIIVTSNAPFIDEQAIPPSLAAYARKKRATLLDQSIQGAVILSVADGQLTATSFVTGEAVTLDKPR